MENSRTPAYIVLLALLLLAGIAIYLLLRNKTPALHEEDLRAAQRLWRDQSVSDYSVTVLKELDAREAERIITRVSDGKVSEFLLNGEAIERGDRPYLSDTYTVDGLFAVMSRELEMAAETPAEGQPRNAALKARFHEELGLPIVFKRLAPERRSFFLTIEEFSVPGRGVLYSSD